MFAVYVWRCSSKLAEDGKCCHIGISQSFKSLQVVHAVGYSPDERRLLVDLDLTPNRDNLLPVSLDVSDSVPIRNDVNQANKVCLSGRLTVKIISLISKVSRPKRSTKKVERLNIKTNRGQIIHLMYIRKV